VEVGTEKMQFEQLPALASEVARVEMVREYAGEYRSSAK
jgi:RAD50-interacting protein 1